MANLNRRTFLAASVAVTAAASAPRALVASASGYAEAGEVFNRILVGSDTPNGILSFQWDAATGTLTPEPIAAKIDQSTWIELSPNNSTGKRLLYVASEVDEFEGKPTGAVASYALANGKLTPISIVPSTGKGTCHLTTDHTGRVVICANYTGGSAASFLSTNGKLSQAVWSEQYKGYRDGNDKPAHGPVADRQEAAHAHFASLSPDNRFVYINDLGADKIHIYKLEHATGKLMPAGIYNAEPGDGPRTLHFHPNGKIAYCMNELNSTVAVLKWNPAGPALEPIQRVSLLHEAPKPGITNTGCDTVLTRDGRFAYFANRGDDFLMGYSVDPATGRLTPLSNPRIATGGKTPRNFTLDPTERWMLVANQNSSLITVFTRNAKTGELAREGKSFPAPTPMCIVFV
jgi:6-phosphogluconolactonase